VPSSPMEKTKRNSGKFANVLFVSKLA